MDDDSDEEIVNADEESNSKLSEQNNRPGVTN